MNYKILKACNDVFLDVIHFTEMAGNNFHPATVLHDTFHNATKDINLIATSLDKGKPLT